MGPAWPINHYAAPPIRAASKVTPATTAGAVSTNLPPATTDSHPDYPGSSSPTPR
ncbi:MAG: hypothetical protein JWL99_5893 [Streptomyces oryziradicis]|nr:hypothetical protein [Actinacidiphila oryziradicis]